MLILSEKSPLATGWPRRFRRTYKATNEFTTEAIYFLPSPPAPLQQNCTKSNFWKSPNRFLELIYRNDTRLADKPTTQPLSLAPNTSQSQVGRGPTRAPQRAFLQSVGGLLTCRSWGRAPGAAGRRLGLRVAAGAVRGLRRPFLSAPGSGGLGAFTGHGRWGRVRAGS